MATPPAFSEDTVRRALSDEGPLGRHGLLQAMIPMLQGLPDSRLWTTLAQGLDPNDPRPEVAQALVAAVKSLVSRPVADPVALAARLDALLPKIHWALTRDRRAPSAAWGLLETAARSMTFPAVYQSFAPFVDLAIQTLDWSLLAQMAPRRATAQPFRGVTEHPAAWAWLLTHTPLEIRGSVAARSLSFDRSEKEREALLEAGALEWPWPMAAIYQRTMSHPRNTPEQRVKIWDSWVAAIEATLLDAGRSAGVRAKFHAECLPLRAVMLTDYYRAHERQDALAARPASPQRSRRRA